MLMNRIYLYNQGMKHYPYNFAIIHSVSSFGILSLSSRDAGNQDGDTQQGFPFVNQIPSQHI